MPRKGEGILKAAASSSDEKEIKRAISIGSAARLADDDLEVCRVALKALKVLRVVEARVTDVLSGKHASLSLKEIEQLIETAKESGVRSDLLQKLEKTKADRKAADAAAALRVRTSRPKVQMGGVARPQKSPVNIQRDAERQTQKDIALTAEQCIEWIRSTLFRIAGNRPRIPLQTLADALRMENKDRYAYLQQKFGRMGSARFPRKRVGGGLKRLIQMKSQVFKLEADQKRATCTT